MYILMVMRPSGDFSLNKTMSFLIAHLQIFSLGANVPPWIDVRLGEPAQRVIPVTLKRIRDQGCSGRTARNWRCASSASSRTRATCARRARSRSVRTGHKLRAFIARPSYWEWPRRVALSAALVLDRRPQMLGQWLSVDTPRSPI